MCAAEAEGGGGAGSVAVATAGEPVAGLGLTLHAAQWRRPPPPTPPPALSFSGQRSQNFRAKPHSRLFSNSAVLVTSGESKGQRS